MDEKKFNFVYVTKNMINGKKYIGKHSTDDLFDGYVGSGTLLKAAISKYGLNNFETTIIKLFETSDEAYEYEEMLVDCDVTESPNYYNIDLGGKGSRRKSQTSESNAKRSISLKGVPKPPRSEAHKLNLKLAGLKRRKPPRPRKIRTMPKGKDNSLFGKKRPQSVVEKCKSANRTHPIWDSYSNLFQIWLKNDKPGWRKMLRISVENGYPETSYSAIINQFKEDILNGRTN